MYMERIEGKILISKLCKLYILFISKRKIVLLAFLKMFPEIGYRRWLDTAPNYFKSLLGCSSVAEPFPQYYCSDLQKL
jgi:hypothetical protein